MRLAILHSDPDRGPRPAVFLFAAAIFASLPLACATPTPPELGDDPSSADAGSSTGGGDAASGPCTYAEDCTAFSDTCNVGACINGACAKVAANDFTPCDDGKTCTQNDFCQAGVCSGPARSCPASDSCHVGSCDLDLDACIEVPGNDGNGCIDDDPCSLTGACSGGVCAPGLPVDCSFLDGPCSVGSCDPQIGCVSDPQSDGAACDDFLFCTVNDHCAGGICVGVPNPCAPLGDICLIGACSEAAKACSAVPGNSGAVCNDHSTCTVGETCSNGLCNGGDPANPGGACDDGKACTTADTCANGTCSGTAVVACQSGDGCCPPGCDISVDDDCGGVVYMASANGDPGFYGYDVGANSWSVLPDAPVRTSTQITTDGTHVLLLGWDNFLYSFDPNTNVWSQGQAGPGPEAQEPIGFLKWTPNAIYYIKDGNATIKYSSGGGPWVTVNLPSVMSCAGTFDPATGNLYIRHFGTLGLSVFDTASNTVTQSWSSGTHCDENSRTGSYFGGFFYARNWSGPLVKIDVTTGAMIDTFVTPSEGHTATDVDLTTGDIYIGPYEFTGTTFEVYRPSTNDLTPLAPAPVPLFNHSTIVFVK